MGKRKCMDVKNIKISRKIYFTGVNERSLARGEPLLEGCPVNAVVSGFQEEKARESAEYFVKVVAFPKARLHMCARSTVQHVVNPRRPHRPLGDPATPNVSLSVAIWPRAK